MRLSSWTSDVKVGGIVLCGGQSRRMGTPKAWLPFGDEPMLSRVVTALAAVVDPVVVIAGPGQEVPTLHPNVAVVRDSVPHRGPLVGLSTGLGALSGCADAAYVSSCDVPLLQPEFVRFLVDQLGEEAIVAPWDGERYHPLSAVYRHSVLPEIEAMLREECFRLTLLLHRCTVRRILTDNLREVDPDLRSLKNINTPEDYQALVELVGGK